VNISGTDEDSDKI